MPDEVESVAELWLSMGLELHPQSTPSRETWIELTQGLFRSGKYHIVVAEHEGQLVGFVDGFVYLEPTSGQLTGISQYIYIMPAYRMGDVAPRMYELIQRLVNGDGAQTVLITAELQTKRMWERKGFVVEKYIMRKQVEMEV